jgi:hypothetical protein
MMSRPGLPGIGYWWRFSAYEMRDMVIGPAAGARLEQYDPWASPKAYQSLLDLARGPRLFPPSPEAERQILEWVTEHGLLGVLPHEVLMMTLPPQWLPLSPPLGDNDEMLFPTSVSYIRTSTGWASQGRASMSYPLLTQAPERKGSAVDPDVIRDIVQNRGVIPPAQVIRQPIGRDELMFEDTDSACRLFFRFDVPFSLDDLRRLPPRGVYPQPFSDEFWSRYCEPLPNFLSAADELLSALEGLARAHRGMSREDTAMVWRAGKRLHALLAPVSPILHDLYEGTLRQRWASTSLLATLAMQAYLDLTADGRVLICICGRVFISADRRAAFCSPQCRWRAHQRAYRKRQARKKRTQQTSAKKGTRR